MSVHIIMKKGNGNEEVSKYTLLFSTAENRKIFSNEVRKKYNFTENRGLNERNEFFAAMPDSRDIVTAVN